MAEPTPPAPIHIRTRQRRPFDDPRTAALEALNRLNRGDGTLDAILDELAPMTGKLSHRDRALFNQLVYGVIRWRLRLDSLIAAYTVRSLNNVSPPILNILRTGVYQLLFMDRIPPSAAVNTAVNLVRYIGAANAAGFVNAVLRNVIREPDRFDLPDAVGAPIDHLAISESIPHWLIERWIERMGFAETRRLCRAVNAIPPITLRCNRLKNNPAELLRALADQADRVEVLDDLPDAIDLARPHCAISSMQAFLEGRFAVQDGGAQLVSMLLAPQPGEMVLDACAGLGGKTTHLAQLMNNQGSLIAMDNVSGKLTSIDKEARRLGVSIIRTRHADLNRPIASTTPDRFDRVLLDAPCSGLGVLRRNPDAKWSARKRDLTRFSRRQTRFLDHVAPLVKIDGILVFAVCSMEPEENERVIETFLKKHPNFVISGSRAINEKWVLPFMGEDGFLRTVPHIHRMDGFFAARLKRTS
ncbi:MAG: 16S rRNA (cytosine(967)-C(5))-methyltransferase RsmB [Desulfosarcina sp.]